MVKIMGLSGSAVIRMVMVKFWWQALALALAVALAGPEGV